MTPTRPPGYRAAAALFAAAWLALAWPWLSGAVTIPWDAKAHFYPQLRFLARALHAGESPFWTPYAFSGWPQIADPQSLVFSSPYLALAALAPDPGFRAADGVLLGMLGLGGLGLMALFRDRGWGAPGALVAALAFAFGASAAWRLQHVGQVTSLAGLPVALWLLARALARGSAVWGLAAGLTAGVLALGRDQVAMLGIWTLAGFVAWWWIEGDARSPRERLRGSIPPLLAGLIGGALLTLVPFALTALLAEASNRPGIDYAGAARGSLHPALLLTAWVPNLFGADGPFMQYWGPPSPLWGPGDLVLARNMGVLYLGALPLALLVLGATRGVLLAREVRGFTALFAVMVLYMLGRATPLFPALFHGMPGVDLFRRPADAAFLVGGLGALLAGHVAHRWWTGALPAPGRAARVIEPVLLAGPLAAGLGVALAKGTLGTAAWALGTAGLFLTAALLVVRFAPRGRSPGAALLLVGAFLALDLRVNNGPNESTGLPPSDYAVLRPDSDDPLVRAVRERLAAAPEGSLPRVELAGLGFHWPNASLVHGLHHTLGYNPLRLRDYAAATGAGDHVAVPDQRRFAPLFPSYRSPLADLLGLRVIATGAPVETIDPALRPGDLSALGRVGAAYLYENPRALPRAAFAGRASPADFDAMLASGAWPDRDPDRTVLLSRGETFATGSGAEGAARIVAYRHDEVVLEVEAGGAGFAVLRDPWHPWWFAEVDGRPAAVLRADVLFRAVAVPAGRSRVRFVFRPLRGAWDQVRARLIATSD